MFLIAGKDEAAERTVTVRRLGVEARQTLPLDAAIAALRAEATPPDLR